MSQYISLFVTVYIVLSLQGHHHCNFVVVVRLPKKSANMLNRESIYWYPRIENRHFFLAPTTTTAAVSRSGYPPWILKQGELESSGRILISSNGKTQRIAFLVGKT